MKHILYKLLANTLSVFIVTWMLPTVHLEHSFTAILVVLALVLLNTFLKPLLLLLPFSFSSNIIAIGFFVLFVNALLVVLAGKLVPGFEVASFGAAVLFCILMPLVRFFLEIPERIRQQQIIFRNFTSNGNGFPLFGNPPSEPDASDFQDAEIVEDEPEADEPSDPSSDK